MKTIELTADEQKLISEMDAAMADMNAQRRGALLMIVRSRGAKPGQWVYDAGTLRLMEPNGKE